MKAIAFALLVTVSALATGTVAQADTFQVHGYTTSYGR
jgi:hypothetical protein